MFENIETNRQAEQPKSPRQMKIESHWKDAFDFDNDDFKQQTGIDVYAIRDFRPKMSMLIDWKKGTPEKRQRIINFVKQYRETGISAFISFLENENSDEMILNIGEKSNPDEAQAVFSKIYELSLCVEKIFNELADAFIDTEKLTEEQFQQGKHREAKSIALESVNVITAKINKIINAFHNMIISQEKISSETIKKFLSDLENSQTEITMLSALLKTAKANGQMITPELIRDLKTEKRTIGEPDENGKPAELTKDELEEIIAMFEKNYRENVAKRAKEEDPKEIERIKMAAEKTIEKFLRDIKESNGFQGQIVYLLKFQEKIAGFARFEKSKDNPDEVMAKSFNIHQEVNGCRLGEFFSDTYLEKISKDYDIRAISRADNPANDIYRKQGFEFLDKYINKETGVEYWNIVMRKKIPVNETPPEYPEEYLKEKYANAA